MEVSTYFTRKFPRNHYWNPHSHLNKRWFEIMPAHTFSFIGGQLKRECSEDVILFILADVLGEGRDD